MVAQEQNAEEIWRQLLTGDVQWRKERRFFRLLPTRSPRCKNCHAPVKGIWVPIMRRMGRGPFRHNPRFCDS